MPFSLHHKDNTLAYNAYGSQTILVTKKREKYKDDCFIIEKFPETL